MSLHRTSLQGLARLMGSSSPTDYKTAERSNSRPISRHGVPYHRGRQCLRATWLFFLLGASTALAEIPPSQQTLATAGNAALQSNNNDLAIENYSAINKPVDEITYNLGIAYYRNGDLQQAATQFRMVIGSQNDSVAARARFNLGNAFYSEALIKLNPPTSDTPLPDAPQQPAATIPTTSNASPDVEAGKNLLRSAITQYRSALRINPNDTDARANIELAQSLLDAIDQQQQDQQQQDQQQQDQQQQDQQQQDQQQQDQQQQDQQQQDQQQQDQQAPDSADQGTDEKDDSADSPSGELTAVNEQEAPSDQKRGEPTLIKTDQMTEEEARKLLQSIRDRDMLRRLRKQAADRALRVPVERDW